MRPRRRDREAQRWRERVAKDAITNYPRLFLLSCPVVSWNVRLVPRDLCVVQLRGGKDSGVALGAAIEEQCVARVKLGADDARVNNSKTTMDW